MHERDLIDILLIGTRSPRLLYVELVVAVSKTMRWECSTKESTKCLSCSIMLEFDTVRNSCWIVKRLCFSLSLSPHTIWLCLKQVLRMTQKFDYLSLSLNMGRHSRHVGEQWIHGGALHLHCIYKPFKFEHESVEHSFSVLFYYVAYDYICLCFQFLTPCYDYELLDNWFTAKSTIQTKPSLHYGISYLIEVAWKWKLQNKYHLAS